MNETIQYYSRNAINRGVLEWDDIVVHSEENRNCGEDVTVYIKIKDNIFEDFRFDGDLSIITTACSAVFWESIIGQPIQKVFDMWYSDIVEMIESEVSPRRRRASVFALLATRNAIHKYLLDGKHDDFSDVWVEN